MDRLANDTKAGCELFPIRVWVGYRLAKTRQGAGREDFYKHLGSIFIPATVELMQPWGLLAYLPTVVPEDNNPLAPDEVALVFYQSIDGYRRAATCSVGGRAYQLLHSTIFNFTTSNNEPSSHSGFPQRYNNRLLTGDQPAYYTLFGENIPWQHGEAVVLIALYEGSNPAEFATQLSKTLHSLHAEPPQNMDGAIFTVSGPLIVFWTHWHDTITMTNPLQNVPGLRVIINTTSQHITVAESIVCDYPGIEVTAGDSFNLQFACTSTLAKD